MRFLNYALMAAAIGFAASSQSKAAFIDFESQAATGFTGAHTSLALSNSGVTVTFTRTTGSRFDIDGQTGKPASWGNRNLSPFFTNGTVADAFNANFSQSVNTIAIQFGDYGPSDDDSPVTMTAYAGLNGTGAVLGTDTDTWTANDGFPNFKTLSINAAGVQSIRFTSGGQFPNSLFWDNLSFQADNQAVPVPGGVVLFGIGLATLGAGRLVRRRFAAAA